MIRYRPFRNTDPPAIAELWCRHPPRRALAQPMSAAVLEQRVYSRPYFDRYGLVVAEDGEQIVGFAHGGFCSNEDGSGLDTRMGATCMLMVAQHDQRQRIAHELLHQSEQYLMRHGAGMLFAGSVYPANAFYLGLYGGSHSPGVLQSDADLVELFLSAGYEPVEQYVVVQRHLRGFRPPVDRVQMQLRRRYGIEPELDPPTESWWEACTVGQVERLRHRLISRQDGSHAGSVTFWDMERISAGWGVHAVGLMELEIVENRRGQGLGTFLLGQALRHAHTGSAALAEAQIAEDNRGAIALFSKLGFSRVDRGLILQKKL